MQLLTYASIVPMTTMQFKDDKTFTDTGYIGQQAWQEMFPGATLHPVETGWNIC